MVYKMYNGLLRNDEEVRHTCDIPLCVCPKHLLKGSHTDNVRDAIERGRFKLPPRHRNTVNARKALAKKYLSKKFRKEQGRRISEGFRRKREAL